MTASLVVKKSSTFAEPNMETAGSCEGDGEAAGAGEEAADGAGTVSMAAGCAGDGEMGAGSRTGDWGLMGGDRCCWVTAGWEAEAGVGAESGAAC